LSEVFPFFPNPKSDYRLLAAVSSCLFSTFEVTALIWGGGGISSATTENAFIPMLFSIFVVHFSSWRCLESSHKFICPYCYTAHVWGDMEWSTDGL